MKMKNSKIQSDAKAGMKSKIELVNSNPNNSKTPLKADLVIQLKQLQDDFNALEASNKKNLEKIKCLQEKIKTIESEKQTSPKETQTEHGLELKCDECNFETTNQLELSWHMEKIHGWSQDLNTDDLDSTGGFRDCPRCEYQAEDKYDMDGHKWPEHEDDEDGNINCKFCNEKFASVANLMRHRKIKHR